MALVAQLGTEKMRMPRFCRQIILSAGLRVHQEGSRSFSMEATFLEFEWMKSIMNKHSDSKHIMMGVAGHAEQEDRSSNRIMDARANPEIHCERVLKHSISA